MAYYRLQLPVLKLTRRPTSGGKVCEVVHRARGLTGQGPSQDEQEAWDPPLPEESGPPSGLLNAGFLSEDLVEPTGHELEEQSMVTGWEKVRSEILRAVTEASAIPPDQVCFVCMEETASLRCWRCGHSGYYCPGCFELLHRRVNIFHVAEKWEGDHYEPYVRDNRHIDIRPQHTCTTKKEVCIHCVDEIGMEHKIFLATCSCEPLPITLARAELWPATPNNPHFAFTFSLLDWAEALMLECQVALKDFCSSLKFRCPFNVLKRKGIYSALINSFEEYRLLKHKLRHLDYLADNLNAGNICPACPQLLVASNYTADDREPEDNTSSLNQCLQLFDDQLHEDQSEGSYICSMDALFGLPRKKAAGCSHRGALHRDLFFCEQPPVDEYVACSEQRKRDVPSACNDFLAGSMLRSASRYKALDETAVFGYCCRHEFPGKFINLKHGERLAYAVWMLEDILQSRSKVAARSQLFVMYDIACTLSGHLKSHCRSDILNATHLCLPTFHSYGHKVSCQILFGPRRCEGIGLSDGETMERLWSFLRRFARMTKEMRPAHRIDVLTSALVFYGIRTKERLALLLLTRWEKALKTKGIAEETLHQLMPQPYNEIESKAEEWLGAEVASCAVEKPKTKPIQWHREYFHTLQDFYSVRNQLNTQSHTSDDAACCRQLASLNKTLMEYEKIHSIPSRWLPSDKEYKDCECSVMYTKSEQLLLHIWKAAQRRMFLLKLVKKYADGQKIAKKLSSQINKEARAIRELVSEYHVLQAGDMSTPLLTMEEALDPEQVGTRLQAMGTSTAIAAGEKREVIDSYLLLCRSREEIRLLEQEVQNLVLYYENMKLVVEDEIGRRSAGTTSSFNRGAVSLCHRLLNKVNILLAQGKEVWKVIGAQEERSEYVESVLEDKLSDTDDDDESSDED